MRKHDPDIDDRGLASDRAARIHYLPADATTSDGMAAVGKRVAALWTPARRQRRGNVLFFLSVASSLYEPIVEKIDEAGLVVEGKRWCSIDPGASRAGSGSSSRRPFGNDDATAKSLNRTLGRAFEEESIYRIDHYLAKEIVQSLLGLPVRQHPLGAGLEPAVHRPRPDHRRRDRRRVGQRTAFYDQTGAIRDHDPVAPLPDPRLRRRWNRPPTTRPEHIRSEKVKVIDALVPTPARPGRRITARSGSTRPDGGRTTRASRL